MPDSLKKSFVNKARNTLLHEWDRVVSGSAPAISPTAIPIAIIEAIRQAVNSPTKTYRYVLPTQLLAKVVDDKLDSRCIQAGAGMSGAFDARSLCHAVIVPFDTEHHSVLGGSGSPYLNNPLRIPAIVETELAAQKDKTGFRNLITVLAYAEKHPRQVVAIFRSVLHEVRLRMARVTVVYPVPNRLSLNQVRGILTEFLGDRTGGLRLQACAAALFRTLGKRFALFDSVVTGNINTADAATGSAADMECLDSAGGVVLAVEVKDRRLRIQDVQDKLPTIRQKGVREVLFVVKEGPEQASADAIVNLIQREFVTGQNVYVADIDEFLQAVLILFGEAGRRDFLLQVGEELDGVKADYGHRARWAELLGRA